MFCIVFRYLLSHVIDESWPIAMPRGSRPTARYRDVLCLRKSEVLEAAPGETSVRDRITAGTPHRKHVLPVTPPHPWSPGSYNIILYTRPRAVRRRCRRPFSEPIQ